MIIFRLLLVFWKHFFFGVFRSPSEKWREKCSNMRNENKIHIDVIVNFERKFELNNRNTIGPHLNERKQHGALCFAHWSYKNRLSFFFFFVVTSLSYCCLNLKTAVVFQYLFLFPHILFFIWFSFYLYFFSFLSSFRRGLDKIAEMYYNKV